MVHRNLIKAAREMAELPESGEGRCSTTDCCCPGHVTYIIFTRCLTINNGACPEWEFCEPCESDCPPVDDLLCKG
ncbi:MAG TPA: hypothetical protein GX529_06115 [Firmicutes bacterium]|nr:hypothetical protein [Candidatus Fermentithermobacillaceae bacterium]